jgi:hypothetical protein
VHDETYVYLSLASGVVIPYLTRLLAEQRELVLFDQEGVTASPEIALRDSASRLSC